MPYTTKDKIKPGGKCYEKKCLRCSSTFYTNRPEAKYCCNLCRMYSYIDRKEENKIPFASIQEVKSYLDEHALKRITFYPDIKIGTTKSYKVRNGTIQITRLDRQRYQGKFLCV